MKSALLYHHFDSKDIVDAHVLFTLKQMKKHCDFIFFTSNSKISKNAHMELGKFTDEIIVRKNAGFDYNGWKAALQSKNKEWFNQFDRLMFINNSVFGPVVDIKPLLNKMEKREWDFWTPTEWKYYRPEILPVPPHAQPYFLVVKKRLFSSNTFWKYWENMPEDFRGYQDAVTRGEIELTLAWEKDGFTRATAIDEFDNQNLPDLGAVDPHAYNSIDVLIKRYDAPFVKIKSIVNAVHKPVDISPRVIEAIQEKNYYPVELIKNYAKNYFSLYQQKNFPSTLVNIDNKSPISLSKRTTIKFAVFAHLYYEDLFDEVLHQLQKIKVQHDLFITVKNEKGKHSLLERMPDYELNHKKAIITVPGENRGRDYGPWLVEFGDVQLDYDVALKIQSKKHSQQPEIFGQRWNDYLYSCLLGTSESIDKTINCFIEDEALGIMFPPFPPELVLLAPPAFRGSGSEVNFFRKLVSDLKLNYVEENRYFIFPAGSMFWYRPKALQKLFDHGLKYSSFAKEPISPQGDISHGIERILAYICHDAGFHYRLGITEKEMMKSLQTYENKLVSTTLSTWDILKARGSLDNAEQFSRPRSKIYVTARAIHHKLAVRFPMYHSWYLKIKKALRPPLILD